MITIIAPCYDCGDLAQYRYIQPNGEWGFTFCAKCIWRIASSINNSPYGGYPVNIRPINLEDIERLPNVHI